MAYGQLCLKKQTTILFLSRGYFCFSVNSKIIYFAIVSLFTGGISSLRTKKKHEKRDDSTLLIYAMFLTFSRILQK